MGKHEGKRLVLRSGLRCQNNIKMDIKSRMGPGLDLCGSG